MRHEIKVPDLGEEATEAFVAEWLIEPGATIAAGDEVVEIVTDKANVVVSAEVGGTMVEQCVAEEDRVSVGQVLAIVESDGAEAA